MNSSGTKSITVFRPNSSLTELMYPLGLFETKYTEESFEITTLSTATSSLGPTLIPKVDIVIDGIEYIKGADKVTSFLRRMVKDITVQFEDGLIRKHRRRDHFDLGKIAHVPDKSE